jgi:CBS domain-containing protein
MTAPLPLANSLHRATIEALRRQAPFSAMGDKELAWLVQQPVGGLLRQ